MDQPTQPDHDNLANDVADSLDAADAAARATQTGVVLSVPTVDVVPHPDNVRGSVGDVAELADTEALAVTA